MTETDSILTALIVDDERLARKELISMLGEFESIKVIGEAEDVSGAIKQIEKYNPDVIFLDIQMPGKSGFDLIKEMDIKSKVIFITAFDQHAIRAFEVNALDYLLKPVSPERLEKSISRLKGDEPPLEIDLRKLDYVDRLFLDFGKQTKFVKVCDIVFISAEGDYSKINISDKTKGLVLKSMKEWEERLPEKYFCRIHRSTIINTDYITEINKYYNNSFKLKLRNVEDPLIISRRYAKKLKDRFG